MNYNDLIDAHYLFIRQEKNNDGICVTVREYWFALYRNKIEKMQKVHAQATALEINMCC